MIHRQGKSAKLDDRQISRLYNRERVQTKKIDRSLEYIDTERMSIQERVDTRLNIHI